MRSYRFLHFDVFTDRLFGGNQLAVYLDARGLTASTMQSIAAEMNFSETTFVLTPDRPDTDVRVRIFTPAQELPMAGHPTIGTAFALAFAWMTQQRPTFGLSLDRSEAALRLGLSASDLLPDVPVQTVSCGVPYLIVPLQTRQAVDRAAVDARALRAFADAHGLESSAVYLFSPEAGDDLAHAYCRMFAPALGISEDPATGSAAGPLGCYLVRHGLLPAEAAARVFVRQGVKMRRPSDMHVAIETSGDDIVRVRVGGEAWLAGEGTLYL